MSQPKLTRSATPRQLGETVPKAAWWMVSTTISTSFEVPQFAVIAGSADEAVDRVHETWARELNELLPLGSEITVRDATRLCDA